MLRLNKTVLMEPRIGEVICSVDSLLRLAAGLDGIEHKTDPGPANTSNLYDFSESELAQRGIRIFPMSLREALHHLQGDTGLKQVLGDDFVSYYIQVKTEEWRQYQRTVSEWETDRYLMTF